MTRIMTVVGTRPEIIRLSRVIARLDDTVDHVLVHTGQNWDTDAHRRLLRRAASCATPDHFLGWTPRRSAGCWAACWSAWRRRSPRAAGRAAGARRHQQLHRRADGPADAGAGLPHGGRQPLLRRERAGGDQPAARRPRRRLQPRLHRARPAQPARRGPAPAPDPAHRLADAGGARALPADDRRVRRAATGSASTRAATSWSARTARRTSTTRTGSAGCWTACARSATRWGLPVLVSTHPRTRKRLEALAPDAGRPGRRSRSTSRSASSTTCTCRRRARCALSDSGTISEEAAILGFPAVTLRESIERPEALDAGGDHDDRPGPAGRGRGGRGRPWPRSPPRAVPCPVDYQVTDTSRRVVDFILSTVRRHHDWAGIRRWTRTHEGRRPEPPVAGPGAVRRAVSGTTAPAPRRGGPARPGGRRAAASCATTFSGSSYGSSPLTSIGSQRRHRDVGDQRVQRPVVGLAVAEQLLVQLLARAQAGVDDRRRRRPAWRGQLAGHVDDADRLAHVEHQRLAVAADRRRPGSPAAPPPAIGHEVAGDVGVGDGDRAARRRSAPGTR